MVRAMRLGTRGHAGRLWIALVLLGLTAQAAAQGSRVDVKARLSSGVVKLGDQVVLDLVVENGRNVRIVDVPRVDGLRISGPSGPYRSSYMEIVGGRRRDRSETTYKFSLRPEREGEFELPAFGVDVDGERHETRPLRLKVLLDLAGSDLGFLELTPSTTRVVEGQPFTLELRFGWDAGARVNYASLSLPWWDSLSGVIELEGERTPRSQNEVVVNDELRVPVEAVTDDPDRVVFRLTKSFLPTRSGTLEFQKSFLEFGQAVDGGLFGGVQKRSKFFVPAPAFSLEVVPLPTEGQPLDFSGAVGSLSARATADARDVRVGDSIKLTVDWTGAGNLEFFDPPDLSLADAFRGFQVYGRTEDKSFERRRVVYDLAPLSEDVTEIPPVVLSVFDPESGRYGEVSTAPIPIRVRPLAAAVNLEDAEARAFAEDIADIDATPLGDADGSARGGAPGDALLAGSALGLPVLWLLLRTAVRRRGDPAGERARRRRVALRGLRRRLRRASSPEARLEAFAHFLGDLSGEPAEAWVGRDPLRWAQGRGRPEPEGMRPTRDLLARLEAAAYAGGASVEDDALLAEARRLEGVLR